MNMKARIDVALWGLFAMGTISWAQQLDPIINMCVRFDHQSVVKNNTLYIDGGRETFIDVTGSGSNVQQTGAITEGLNNYLIAIDMSSSWDWKTNISEKALAKTKVPSTGTYPPNLSRGALFQGAESTDNIYLLGGTQSYANTSFSGFRAPYPAQYSLWSYNITSQTWGQYDITFGSENRPSSGSSAEATDQGLGFFFNGQLDSGSEEATANIGDSAKFFLEGMIVVNTNNQTARNLSTQAVVGDTPRSRGRMQYIENLGGKGILVQLGGNQKNVTNSINGYIGDLVSMDEIDVFDVSSVYNSSTPDGTWYKQKTSGDTPGGRIDFCVVLASSADGTSHNVYVYGGRGLNGSTNVFFDDIWVLSIPSFTWTKIFQGTSPRYGHTCHRVGPRTLLTVGGAENTNYNSTPCDWETKGVGIFDMSNLEWGSVFNANALNYSVPNLVTSMIGGSGNGAATMMQPKGGFEQDGLAAIFKTPRKVNGTDGSGNSTGKVPVGSNSTSPSFEQSPPKNFVTSIVGGVIGGVAFIALLAALLWYYRRQVKTILIGQDLFPFLEIGAGREKAEAEMPENNRRWELPGAEKPVEMLSPSEDGRNTRGKVDKAIEMLSPSEGTTTTTTISGDSDSRAEMEAKWRMTETRHENTSPVELPVRTSSRRAPGLGEVDRDKPLPVPRLESGSESEGWGSCGRSGNGRSVASESERSPPYERTGNVGGSWPVDEKT